jgi:hypothetical protein
MRDNTPESLDVCLNHEFHAGTVASVILRTFGGYLSAMIQTDAGGAPLGDAAPALI